MPDKNIQISLKNVYKFYKPTLSLKDRILLRFINQSKQLICKEVLTNISLDITSSEVVGIIGLNGAGKSTLLRVMAGHASAQGQVSISGKILAILSISTGLLDDLSGYQNIFHMGALYGATKLEIQEMLEDIISFSGLNNFINMPIRGYSAGMRARLAFSIITSFKFDVLLIDEALSVGDLSFMSRCQERIAKLCNSGKTIVIVSHGLATLRSLCSRIIWMDEGRVKADGPPDVVLTQYKISQFKSLSKKMSGYFDYSEKSKSFVNWLTVKNFEIINESCPELERVIMVGDIFKLQLTLEILRLEPLFIAIELMRSDGVLILTNDMIIEELSGGINVWTIFDGKMQLGRFIYKISATIRDLQKNIVGIAVYYFSVQDESYAYNSSVYPNIIWRTIA